MDPTIVASFSFLLSARSDWNHAHPILQTPAGGHSQRGSFLRSCVPWSSTFGTEGRPRRLEVHWSTDEWIRVWTDDGTFCCSGRTDSWLTGSSRSWATWLPPADVTFFIALANSSTIWLAVMETTCAFQVICAGNRRRLGGWEVTSF